MPQVQAYFRLAYTIQQEQQQYANPQRNAVCFFLFLVFIFIFCVFVFVQQVMAVSEENMHNKCNDSNNKKH